MIINGFGGKVPQGEKILLETITGSTTFNGTSTANFYLNAAPKILTGWTQTINVLTLNQYSNSGLSAIQLKPTILPNPPTGMKTFGQMSYKESAFTQSFQMSVYGYLKTQAYGLSSSFVTSSSTTWPKSIPSPTNYSWGITGISWTTSRSFPTRTTSMASNYQHDWASASVATSYSVTDLYWMYSFRRLGALSQSNGESGAYWISASGAGGNYGLYYFLDNEPIQLVLQGMGGGIEPYGAGAYGVTAWAPPYSSQYDSTPPTVSYKVEVYGIY